MIHPVQQCLLRDNDFRQSACTALAMIRHCFQVRINALREAYDRQQITEAQLIIARRALLIEARIILYTHHRDDPPTILAKLLLAAEHLQKQTNVFSVQVYISNLHA